MAESLLVGRNFVSNICKLKPKNLFKKSKNFVKICKKNRFLSAVPQIRDHAKSKPYSATEEISGYESSLSLVRHPTLRKISLEFVNKNSSYQQISLNCSIPQW